MVITKTKLHQIVSNGHIQNKLKEVVVDTTSICLHLDNQFTEYMPYNGEPFTPPMTMETTTKTIPIDGEYILPPQGKILACSQEEIEMPYNLLGFIQTKGSIARGFLFTQMRDGQIDPGYRGKITFELLNMSEFYYKLVPGMAIASLFLIQLDDEIKHYNGRYQNSGSPTAMK